MLKIITCCFELLDDFCRHRIRRNPKLVRRSRLLLQELCRAAVHFQRYDEDTLIRRVWQECLKLARFKSRRCVDVDDDSFTLACNEIQEVVSEGLCTESIAWRLASALAVFDEEDVATFMEQAKRKEASTSVSIREEGQSDEDFFGICRNEVLTAVLSVLLENELIEDIPIQDFDPWFQIKRYGYAAACFRVSTSQDLDELNEFLNQLNPLDDGGDGDEKDLDFLEHPIFAVEAAGDAFLDVVKNGSVGTSESLQSKKQLCRALAAALRCFLRCPATKVLVAPVIGEMTRELSDELSMNETEVLQQAVEALKCCGAWPAAMEVNGLETNDEQKRCVWEGYAEVFVKAFRLWVDLMPVTYWYVESPSFPSSIKYTGHGHVLFSKKTGFIGIG